MQRLIEELVALNAQNSQLFCDPGLRAARMRAREEHRVRAVCFKCMDGRINLPLLTGTHMGSIIPFRTMGGIFHIGWPALSDRICDIVDGSISDGRSNVFFVTYHFSRGDTHRGCRGVDYDKGKGMAHAARFVREIEKVFGFGHQQVDVVMLGVETDDDTLIFHDRSTERSFASVEIVRDGKESGIAMLRELYPDMSPRTMNYVLQLVEGNVAHLSELQAHPRHPVSINHTERVLALGRDFDWLHQPNLAIIVNPHDPMLEETIGVAAGIIIANRNEERIPKEQVLLFSSVGYREQGFHYNAAKEQALYLARMGMESIHKFHPEHGDSFHTLVGVVDMYRRKLEIIKVNGQSA
jgi:hypothetical protein